MNAGINKALPAGAIHPVDSLIEASPLTRKYPQLFAKDEASDWSTFAKSVRSETISAIKDDELAGLWMCAKRYGGKGCLNAVANVEQMIAPRFLGRRLSELGSVPDIDRELLALEVDLAIKRGKLPSNATDAQREANLEMNAVLPASLAPGAPGGRARRRGTAGTAAGRRDDAGPQRAVRRARARPGLTARSRRGPPAPATSPPPSRPTSPSPVSPGSRRRREAPHS